MGSASSQLTCPNDYDYNNFNKILKLYDRLDSNGDHSVDMDELTQIANLHVKNQLIKLENMKQPLDDKLKQGIVILEQKHKLDIDKLNHLFENNKKKKIQDKTVEIKKINDEIKHLNNLKDDEKTTKFKKSITDKNGNILFWPFFEYMKTRTEDIPNIEW
tara:strand:- start:9806 stop:10285 length:480 start_codon:yes stop_codon:yes gene_type:complete